LYFVQRTQQAGTALQKYHVFAIIRWGHLDCASVYLEWFGIRGRISAVAYSGGRMLRFRFAVHAATLFLAIAGALLLSGAAAFAQCLPSSGSNSASGSGWVGGGQAGYNWQQGSWVYGLEADLSGTSLKSSMDGGLTSVAPCSGDMASTSAKIDWYGTIRSRVGWAVDKALFYGTGGLAYGEVDLSSSFSSGGVSLNSDTSSVKAGWVVGAGIDYLLQPNLILNLGYQYVDLGSVGLADPLSISQTASARAAFHVVTVGLNWRFSPTGQRSALQPWEGMYIGGHGGGAWGLNTDAIYSSVAPSDIRLKRDIALIGRRGDGLGLYRYRYLWSDTVYVGVMAQEVALVRPDAIVRDALDDYLRVDYGRLGLKLMTLREWDARSNGARL
jgi:outer membrane immunogenic protein